MEQGATYCVLHRVLACDGIYLGLVLRQKIPTDSYKRDKKEVPRSGLINDSRTFYVHSPI